MSSDIRLGLVGAGAIAQLAHLPVLSKIRGARLVAICDNDGPKAGSLAQRLGVPDIFTDIDELLDSDELDAVVRASMWSVPLIVGSSEAVRFATQMSMRARPLPRNAPPVSTTRKSIARPYFVSSSLMRRCWP